MINNITMSDEECRPAINIAPYISKQVLFVRSLHVEEDHPAIKMPFSYTQFGVVLMVDIVGFSQMTSIASSKGDVGAEMLSSQIGAYFDIAIRIIEYHGGDVVKFLGDALLVVFQADPSAERLRTLETTSTTSNSSFDPSCLSEDSSISLLRRDKIIVRKAIECGLELLARLSNYPIYLSEREFSRKLSVSSAGSDDSSNEDGSSNSNSNASLFATNGIQGNGSSWNGLNLMHNSGPTFGASASPHGGVPGRNFINTNTNLGNGSSNSSSRRLSSRRSSVNDGGNTQYTSCDTKLTPITGPQIHSGQTSSHKDSPLRFMGGTGPGPISIPSFQISPPAVASYDDSIAPTTKSGPPAPSGSVEFRKREGSVNSGSTKPGSTSSKSKAGFLSTAKNLFSHSSGSEKQSGSAAGEVLADAGLASEDSHELQLHMALSAGEISNVIIGEIGGDHGLDSLLVQTTGRLEYAICGEQMSMIDDALNLAQAGEVTVTRSAWQYVNPDSYPWNEPRRNCYILRNLGPNIGADLPLMRRVRNEKLFNTPVESNPHYFKYVNKSAIHRLILYPDGAFPAQFRNATILFVSLGDVKPWTPEGLALCQQTILVVHKVTSKYEGFIQQFAVDDKGATILCAFGLPYPRSHEKEAIFAAKGAWLIRQRLLDADIHSFKISLATGVIFTSTIGNEFRRDPAIVGDTIVIAVRILKFEYATESVVCDDPTMLACTCDHDGLCEFEDMGEEYVKGKLHPLRIWKLVHFGAKKQTRRPDDVLVDETIGYEPEREKVNSFITAWSQASNGNTILVTGPRGSGKCMFYQQICHIADKQGFQICSAASAEVEHNTEYYLIKFLLLGLFDIMRKREIPYASNNFLRVAPPMAVTDSDGRDAQVLDADVAPSAALVDESEHLRARSMGNAQAKALADTEVIGDPAALLSRSLYPPNDRVGEHNHCRSTVFIADDFFSPSVSQYEDISGRSPTNLTKLEAFINVCLGKMGAAADSMTMPVLNDIIVAISSDNSTPVVNPTDDQILADFVTLILNYASQFVKVIVMLEDIQWCDNKSLNIIQVIHDRCPAVLVVVFSRPQRDYGGGTILKAITDHANHLEVALEGLKPREIEQVLLRTFRASGVSRISPEIIELVQERTKGNPKFVKNISLMLQEFCHVSVVDGELLTTGKEATPSPSSKSMEEMLLKQDRKKVTLMQYDRLRPKFQDFVKIASCLGEKFTLAEVGAIKPVEALLGAVEHGKSYSTVISDLDTYKFLSLATEQQTNIQFSTNAVLQTIYTFGSPSTASDIYESIPYEERVGYHLKMGLFYESFLEQQTQNEDLTEQPLNCQDLLPQIVYHYMKTDYTEKKIKYLKALSAFYLKSNMLTVATDKINELIKILDTERGARDLISEEDLADIYGMKGESLSKRMRIEEAEPALMDSLAMYGIHWPVNKSQWKRELLKEGLRFKYYYHRGLTPVTQKLGKKPLKSKVNAKTQTRLSRLIRVLSCLQNIYFWRTQPESALLSSYYTLHCSRKLGIPCGDQTCSLARIAILNYYQGNKHDCEKYMSDARNRNEAGDTTGGMFEAMDAYVEYSEGRQAEAHRLLDLAINESKTFGVVTHLATFYRAVTQKTAYRMWEGAFNVNPKDCQLLRTLSAVAIQNGDSEGETLFAIPTLANLLIQDRLKDAESWVLLIERYIMPKARLMNLLIVHGVLSFYYAKLGNYEKSRIFIELQAHAIEEQGVGAHPFPLMSCMFALLAAYEIHSKVHTAAGLGCPETTPICPARGDVIMRRIIEYLKTDPLKLVADPLICFADAMRSFVVPGQEKEGAMKLLQGYHDLGSSLDAINFVKAFFLTQLGRYSEPCMKDEYYKQAHRLFQTMSMDPLIWLTDPTPTWLPPPVDESKFNFIMGDIPVPTDAEVLEEGSLGWAAAEASIANMASPPLPPPAAPVSVGVATTQDEVIGINMMMNADVKMDEDSFGCELAAASVSSAPIVHDMHEGIDPPGVQ